MYDKDIPVVILAGGKGIRLGKDNSLIPKPMIDINGKPLLFYIIDHYVSFGFKKFVIAGGTGISFYNGGTLSPLFMDIRYRLKSRLLTP